MEWSDFSRMLEFPFTAEQLEKFAALEELVSRLNRKHNLVSANDLPLLRERHLQDGLTALSWMRDAKGRHLDLGSGTGFPLLPLAIAQPGRMFVGVESRSTRVMQMRYLAGELGLRAKPFLSSGGRFITFKSERASVPVDGTEPRCREYRLHPQLKSYFSVCLEKKA